MDQEASLKEQFESEKADALKKLQETYDAEMAKLKKRIDEQQETYEAGTEQLIAKLENEHQQAIDTLAQEAKSREEQWAERIDQEIKKRESSEKLVKEQADQLVRDALAEQQQALKKEEDRKMQQLMSEFESNQSKRAADLQAEKSSEISKTRQAYEEKIAALNQQIKSLHKAAAEEQPVENPETVEHKGETVTDALESTLDMKDLLEKYQGAIVGINYDHPTQIKPAELVRVNVDHICIKVPVNESTYNFPFRNIISVVEADAEKRSQTTDSIKEPVITILLYRVVF